MFYYEMHCHSSACSACSSISPAELALSYKNAGYSGLVLTDHCSRGNTCVDRKLPWKEQADIFYGAYLEAQAAAEDDGFTVMFGLEYGYGEGKEALLYGIDIDFLSDLDCFHTASIEEVSRRVREYGGVIIAAHPMRSRPYIPHLNEPDMSLFDGMEKYNFADRAEDDERELALAAKHPDIIHTAGGDRHCAVTELLAGIATEHRINDNKQLVKTLKERNFHSFCKGKLPFGDIK